MALSVSVTVGAPASDAIRTSVPFLMNPTRLPSGEKNGLRGAVGAGDRRRVELVDAAGARGGCRPPRARCTPAPGRRARARCAPPPAWLGRLQRLARLEREAELAQERRRRRAEPAPERGGGGRGQRQRRAPARATPGRRAPARPVAAARRQPRPRASTRWTCSDLSRSASANSAAVANRSAGSFSSAVSTAASTWRGIVWRCGSERPRALGHHPRHDRLGRARR